MSQLDASIIFLAMDMLLSRSFCFPCSVNAALPALTAWSYYPDAAEYSCSTQYVAEKPDKGFPNPLQAAIFLFGLMISS
ncbi:MULTISPECIES: hypothetical protein [unclassified Endozoicomonas]|uniref:hypothetical protein n=1 Tax=unclassified Endozoicomonas TaxID=2644528 RepID=UPI003BB62A80